MAQVEMGPIRAVLEWAKFQRTLKDLTFDSA